MLTAISLVAIFVASAAAAPLYGQDGGYKGYASYRPVPYSAKSYGVPSKYHSPVRPPPPYNSNKHVYHTNPVYPENVEIVAPEYAPIRQSALSGGVRKIKPAAVVEFDDGLAIDPEYLNAFERNGDSSAPSYKRASPYAARNAGYNLADETKSSPRSYSGDTYRQEDNSAEPAKPYEYGYVVKDDEGHEQFKSEASNGDGAIHGAYGFRDPYGKFRHVEYVADKTGLRANVKTNEPGVESKNPANVHVDAAPAVARH